MELHFKNRRKQKKLNIKLKAVHLVIIKRFFYLTENIFKIISFFFYVFFLLKIQCYLVWKISNSITICQTVSKILIFCHLLIIIPGKMSDFKIIWFYNIFIFFLYICVIGMSIYFIVEVNKKNNNLLNPGILVFSS